MSLVVYDASKHSKVELVQEARRRVCVWSELGGSQLPGPLHELRHFLVVDVFTRLLRQQGLLVEHAVAGSAFQLESDFRGLRLTFPDHWVVASPRVNDPLSSLLPGEPAQEVFTSAIPLSRPRGAVLEARRYLLVNSTPVPGYTLSDAEGNPLSDGSPPASGTRLHGQTPATLEEVFSWGLSAGAFRLHCLRVHYRRGLSFSRSALQRSARAYDALVGNVARLGEARADIESPSALAAEATLHAALNSDLNSARALSRLNVLLTNPQIAEPEKLELVLRADALLGLGLSSSAAARRSPKIPAPKGEFQLVA
jgi:hypothetical protein